MQLSDSNLELVRTSPQSTELFLSIFQPNTAMACLVSGTVSRGSRTIPYKSVSSGSYLAIESGMTLLVGTTAGGRELGKVRIKSATAVNIEVAENSDIDWPSATNLTVLRYWENWPVYPRIISDPNNQENVIFYKDWDVVYTNQNSILGAFPCAGPHRAGWAGDSFYYSSTGTTHLLGSALTYDWAFEGGSNITGSTSATPGYVRYDTPGHYVTRLRVTGANGSIDTTYRYVSVYNKPQNSSANNPPKKWNIDTVSGGRGESGYNTTIRITDESTRIYDGDVVVVFSDNWYGPTNINIGGNAENNSSIFFVGNIVNNSIAWDYKTSSMEFEVTSVTQFLKQMEGFSVSVESKPSPATWYELLDMDGRRALYHYLRWHSTVLSLNDFQFIGTDQKIQFFDADRQSVFDAIDNFMRGTLIGQVTADLQGKIFAEVQAKAYNNPTGSFPTQMSITKRDWVGEPSLQEDLIPELSHIEAGGVAYSGSTTGTFSALLSNAPGGTPGYRGNTEQLSGLALASQSQLNILTGNLLANRIAKYKRIGMQLGHNYRNIDIAPQMTVAMDIAASDTTRGVEIHAPYIPESIRWNYDVKNKILLPEVDFEVLVNGVAGETITIPPVQDLTSKGFNVPKFRIPSIPSLIPSSSISLAGSFYNGYGSADIIGSLTSASNATNFVNTAGDPTFVTVGTPVAFPVISVGGLYLLNAKLRLPSLSFTAASLTITNLSVFFDGGSTGSVEMYFGNLTVHTAEINYFGYLPAGFVINTQVGWTKTTTDTTTARVLLSLVKLG